MDFHKLIQELIDIQSEAEHELQIAESASARDILVSLEESALEIGRAWSKSWIGDQANLYYRDFKPPPPDEEFDQLSGKLLRDQSSWVQYSDEEVLSRINEGLDVSDFQRAAEIADKCSEAFEESKSAVVSILELADPKENSYINGIRIAIDDVPIPTENQILKNLTPNGIMTRDIIALSKGPRTPPHLKLFARVASVRHGIDALCSLKNYIEKAIKHFRRATNGKASILRNGNKIFIGHGHSTEWLKLKDFLKSRLDQEISEYNEESAAGTDILGHVVSLIDNACIAFLVMTAEDRMIGENETEKTHPRLNVVHELGICQAKLGPNKAISLVEKGCQVPTNIIGINYIPFEKGNIMSASEQVRRVLTREGIT